MDTLNQGAVNPYGRCDSPYLDGLQLCIHASSVYGINLYGYWTDACGWVNGHKLIASSNDGKSPGSEERLAAVPADVRDAMMALGKWLGELQEDASAHLRR